jgi:hypothetical protein
VPRNLAPALLIGSEALLAAWQRYASKAPQVVPLVHTDLHRAMRVIDDTEAQVIIIEQAVAATKPGAAVMVQIHNQRTWRGTEIRLLPDTAVNRLITAEPAGLDPQEWLTDLASPLPPRPQRGAPRIQASGDEEVSINGDAVTLADWSTTGVQVRSKEMLRPNQRVRVTLSKGGKTVRTRGVVAWSTLSISPPPEYRAGIALEQPVTEFIGATKGEPSASAPRPECGHLHRPIRSEGWPQENVARSALRRRLLLS